MLATRLKSEMLKETRVSDVENQESAKCKQTKMIKFSVNEKRKILRGKCLFHLNKSAIYTGMDVETGELFFLREWTVEGDEDVKEISKYLTTLIELRHCNLAEFRSFYYEKIEENKWKFYALQEYVHGTNCFSLFLTKNIPIQVDMLRHIAKSILYSLEILEKNGIEEVNLKDSYIYFDAKGDIKVIDYGFGERCFSSTVTDLDQHVDSKIANTLHGFRVLLLSLLKGKVVENDLELPFVVPEALRDFLSKLRKKQKQVTIHQLLNHPFLTHVDDQLGFITEAFDMQEYVPKSEMLKRSRSRLEDEFEVIELIGKGGFGEVHKVKAKLDKQVYALKKIKLNPDNQKLNNKLIREVEYLSQLNHENIVRYYNSWTQDTENIEEDLDTDDYDLEDSIQFDEEISPPINYDSNFYERLSSPFFIEATSDGIENLECYEDTTTINSDEESETASVETDSNISLVQVNSGKILCILMEFCESKTLKDAIDRDMLHYLGDRIWKFLRQIVEGLFHIHQQGIIHRDLKPTNIFLYSNDHVKIGDFGLATTNKHYKMDAPLKENESTGEISKAESGSLTSRVGTTLYKAPELNSSHICNEKLDMYSLGIILFEMCYAPPKTQTERIAVIERLRSKEITFPEDFDLVSFQKQQKIIKELLNHNPLERPTSQQLLNSNRIPPLVKEEEKHQEMFRYVINNPQLQLFKYLMECCFNQELANNNSSNIVYKNISKLESISQVVLGIFKKHGGQNLSMNNLIQQSGCNGSQCQSCVRLMTPLGNIVSIPCNSRSSFVRYVALNRNITWLRRYSLEKIPQKLQRPGYYQANYECVFDIITPINLRKLKNFLPDAEILKIISEIQNTFPSLQLNNSVILNVNHSLLIEAIFLECEILDSQYRKLVVLILTSGIGVHKRMILKNYMSEELSLKVIKLTETAYSINKWNSLLQNFTKPDAIEFARKGIEELNYIVVTAKALGVECGIMLKPGLLNNFEQSCGMLVELTCHVKRKMVVLASGGRYDSLIEQFQNVQKCRLIKYGIGISVNLENLCEVVEVEKNEKTSEIVVCSFSSKAVLLKKTQILRDLWEAGVRCSFIKASKKKHLKDYCKNYNVTKAIIVTKKNIDKGHVSIIEWKNRWSSFESKLVNIQEVVAAVKGNVINVRHCNNLLVTKHLNSEPVRYNLLVTNPLNSEPSTSIISRTSHELALIPTVMWSNQFSQSPSEFQSWLRSNIIFNTSEELSSIVKMQWEDKIIEQSSILKSRLFGNTLIIATDSKINAINYFATSVNFDSNKGYTLSLQKFSEKYPRQYKHLKKTCERVYEEKLKYGHVNLILYNLKESTFFTHLL